MRAGRPGGTLAVLGLALAVASACGSEPLVGADVPDGLVEAVDDAPAPADTEPTDMAPTEAVSTDAGSTDLGPADVAPTDVPGAEVDGDGPACPRPQAPTPTLLPAGTRLVFTLPGGAPLLVGASADPQAVEPDAWKPGPEVVLGAAGPGDDEIPRQARVFARAADPACADAEPFAFTYTLQAAFPPAAGQPGSDALAADDPAIVAWAGAVEAVSWGADLDDTWHHPELALGPAGVDAMSVVPLGNGGALTVRFAPPFRDGQGADLAVFENGLNDTFLEVARVEVSSDGVTFVRFDSVYLGEQPVGPYAGHDPTSFFGLAGRHREGYGTPFDLAELANRPEVASGALDLQAVAFVRVADVVGDGSELDGFGHPIYDPTPTWGSAGFDLDGIAALHGAP